jgi:hypothetical protein
MSQEDSNNLYFESAEKFDSDVSYVCKDPYSEYLKFQKFFEQHIDKFGRDSFHPTISVFSCHQNIVGVVTCRDTENKDDLYIALAEMLYFPMSISSELFIIATDVTVTSADDTKKDAMVVTFVTPEHCLIFTTPYTYNSDNSINWLMHESFINKVTHSITNGDSPLGDMVELFFVFSHSNNPGPFTYEEVLRYFNVNGFSYQILNEQNIDDKNSIAIRFG